jgi:TP901 family phage tail tape measure protein
MLRDGADGLVAVMEEAQRLGLVMSSEDATAAAALTDAWTRLKSSLKTAVIQIGAALAPALQKLANWLTKIGRPLVDWIRQNKNLVVTVAAVAAGVMAGGAAPFGLIQPVSRLLLCPKWRGCRPSPRRAQAK